VFFLLENFPFPWKLSRWTHYPVLSSIDSLSICGEALLIHKPPNPYPCQFSLRFPAFVEELKIADDRLYLDQEFLIVAMLFVSFGHDLPDFHLVPELHLGEVFPVPPYQLDNGCPIFHFRHPLQTKSSGHHQPFTDKI